SLPTNRPANEASSPITAVSLPIPTSFAGSAMGSLLRNAKDNPGGTGVEWPPDGKPRPDRPRGGGRHPAGDRAPGAPARDDRLRELRLRGRARGHGHRAHKQVRGGLPRQALL